MEAFIVGISVVEQLLSIAQAFGLDCAIADDNTKKLLKKLEETDHSINELKKRVKSESDQIKNLVTTAIVISVQSRLKNIRKVRSDKLDLLIRLLFCLRNKAPNIVFIVVVKYKDGNQTSTLGFAGASCDPIQDLIRKIDSFLRAVSYVSASKTTYTGIRIRGKYDPRIESFCTAVLTTIVTDVCELSRELEPENVRTCKLSARGKRTFIMLEPLHIADDRRECDKLRRVFLVGDTRSGKSTFGNAFVQKKKFMVSKGMTGTMRIERSDRVEDIDNERIVTETYDTPGLNDKDELDIWYQSAIEDQVSILQQASSLIMTIAVDAGMTGSALTSLKLYKRLFGSSMASMLIVVLTINQAATRKELEKCLERNRPSVLRLEGTISQRNIHCVSLHDLREEKKSHSHNVVRTIAGKCQRMPMKRIEAFEQKYRQLLKAFSRQSDDIKRRVRVVLNDGWQSYDNLTEQYENRRCSEMIGGDKCYVEGFVMSNSSKKNIAIKAATFGVCDRIRKVTIHISPHEKKAKCVWKKFFKENGSKSNKLDLMRRFGNELYNSGLGVVVRELSDYRASLLRVKRYEVAIFDPVNRAHEQLAAYAQKMIEKDPQDIKREVIEEFTKRFMPCAIRCSKPVSNHKKAKK